MNRERLKTLRDHLAGLSDERVRLNGYFMRADDPSGTDIYPKSPDDFLADCGTAACVAGWSVTLFGKYVEGNAGTGDAAGALLGLTPDQSDKLFQPRGWVRDGDDDLAYGRLDAIAAIDSMLANPDDNALPVWPEKAVSA